jgi:hypothetical protein
MKIHLLPFPIFVPNFNKKISFIRCIKEKAVVPSPFSDFFPLGKGRFYLLIEMTRVWYPLAYLSLLAGKSEPQAGLGSQQLMNWDQQYRPTVSMCRGQGMQLRGNSSKSISDSASRQVFNPVIQQGYFCLSLTHVSELVQNLQKNCYKYLAPRSLEGLISLGGRKRLMYGVSLLTCIPGWMRSHLRTGLNLLLALWEALSECLLHYGRIIHSCGIETPRKAGCR